jgi:hypothetical protein
MVGLPRLSRISRPVISTMAVMASLEAGGYLGAVLLHNQPAARKA